MRYTSSVRLLGQPLADIHVADRGGRQIARGWIALGDMAVGRLFAAGGFAIAPIAVGGITVGLLSFGGVTLGLFAIGGAAIGVWSVGGLALALHAALGGLAVAAQFASGGVAFAAHANDAVAKAFFASSGPFVFTRSALAAGRWLPILLLIPLTAAALRRRRGV